MTNPVALPKPPSSEAGKKNKDPPTHYYEGNVQLMEARYLELTSSIRALYRSVEELREFCKHPDTAEQADHVVVEAIFENLGVLRKQRRELSYVVAKMNQLKADTNMPDDIRIMVLGDEEEETMEVATSTTSGTGTGDSDDGLYL